MTGKEVKCSLNLRQDNFGRSAACSGGSAATVWTATVCCSTTEKHTCVQLISKYHIFCNHFKDAVLPLDKELYRELICGNDYKCCQSCGSRFYSQVRNKRYCDKCADRIKRQKAAERKRRQRERQKQLLYINN